MVKFLEHSVWKQNENKRGNEESAVRTHGLSSVILSKWRGFVASSFTTSILAVVSVTAGLLALQHPCKTGKHILVLLGQHPLWAGPQGLLRSQGRAGFAPSLCSNSPHANCCCPFLSVHLVLLHCYRSIPPASVSCLGSSESLFATGSFCSASCPCPFTLAILLLPDHTVS